MKQGILDFVGSDGHRQNERIPRLVNALQKWKNNGKRICKKILIDNPGKITER